jgi:hypothetical protein
VITQKFLCKYTPRSKKEEPIILVVVSCDRIADGNAQKHAGNFPRRPCSSIYLNCLNAHTLEHICADSVVVITRRCQRLNPGSSPGRRIQAWSSSPDILLFNLKVPLRIICPLRPLIPFLLILYLLNSSILRKVFHR